MRFAFSVEKTTNETFVKFSQSKFKNHIPKTRFTFLSTSVFIATSRTYAS